MFSVCAFSNGGNYPYYYASSDGNIYSFKRGKNGRILAYCIDTKGYAQVGLWNENGKKIFIVHRIIAELFIPNPENKPQVNHIDGNKLNNSVSNLEWVTNQENNLHSIENSLSNRGTKQTINTSGYIGVSLIKVRGDYMACISVNHKTINLGYFKDPILAAKAYDNGSLKYHINSSGLHVGKLNFPEVSNV